MELELEIFKIIWAHLSQGSKYAVLPVGLGFLFRNQLKVLFLKMIQKVLDLRGEERVRKLNLLAHPFFEYMDTARMRHIKHIHFDSLNKTKIIKNILLIKFRVFESNFKQLAEDKDLDKLNKDVLRKTVIEVFEGSINEYNDDAKKHFQDKGLRKEDIHYILNTFNRWNETTIEIVSDSIREVIMSDFYPNNRFRMDSVLWKLRLSFEMTIKNSVDAFREMNGKLDKIDY